MEQYKKLAKELINQHIEYVQSYEPTKTRREVLEELQDDTDNVFGNIDGSRTCNTFKAIEFINQSGAIWDEDIQSLYNSIDDNYMVNTISRGAEVFDVITLELVAPQVINEMMEV